MTTKIPTDQFSYSYLAGPIDTPEELERLTEGNCRLAIQLYFYRVRGVFLKKDEIYLPGGYQHLGSFVYKEAAIDWKQALPGDIVYAQNIKKKDGSPFERNRDNYPNYEDWVYDFHSAIYTGNNQIYHATSIENGPVVWSLQQFSEYYKPMSLKRLAE